MLVERVDEYLKGGGQYIDESILEDMKEAFDFSVMRQLMEERETGNSLRGSNPGPCARQMAYAYLGYPATREIVPRVKLTWLTGDLIELIAVGVLKLAQVKLSHTILDEEGQQEGYFDVGNGVMIPCHGDGIIEPQAGLTEEPILLEIKSTNHFSFGREWKKGKVSDGYLLQHNIYLDAFDLDRGMFFVVNKNTGHYTEVPVERDPDFIEWGRKNYELASIADPENLPPRFEDQENYGRKFDKKGNPKNELNWGCGYCDFAGHCWPSLEVDLEKRRPKYEIVLAEEKDVPTVGRFGVQKGEQAELDFDFNFEEEEV